MSSGISSHTSIKNISQQLLNLEAKSQDNRVAITDKHLLPVKKTFTSLAEHPLFQKKPAHDVDLNAREISKIDLGVSTAEQKTQVSVKEEPIYDIPKNNQSVNKAVMDEENYYQTPKNNQPVYSENIANESSYQEIQEEAIYEEIPYNFFSKSLKSNDSVKDNSDLVSLNSDVSQSNKKSLKNRLKNKLKTLESFYEVLSSIKHKVKSNVKEYFGLGLQQEALLAQRQAVMDRQLKIHLGTSVDSRGKFPEEFKSHFIPSMGVENKPVSQGYVKVQSGAKHEERMRAIQSRPLPPLPEPLSQSEVNLYDIKFNGPVLKASEQQYDIPRFVSEEPIYDVPKSLKEEPIYDVPKPLGEESFYDIK